MKMGCNPSHGGSTWLHRLGRRNGASTRSHSGITLVEVMVYFSALTLVTGLAFGLFYKYWDQTKLLTRTADDIARVLRAGEQWREDIRSAIGPVECDASPDSSRLRIPQAGGEVVFLFEAGEVWRYETNSAIQREILVVQARSSEFIADSNRHVQSWRWELELPMRRKNARIHPLFTFMAVPGHSDRKTAE